MSKAERVAEIVRERAGVWWLLVGAKGLGNAEDVKRFQARYDELNKRYMRKVKGA